MLPDQPAPTSLWVGILFEKNKDGSWNAFTDGLNPLGSPDIEIHHSKLNRLTLYKLLQSTTEKIISTDSKLQAGDIIEDAEGKEWKVTTGKSAIAKANPIWVLQPVAP